MERGFLDQKVRVTVLEASRNGAIWVAGQQRNGGKAKCGILRFL